MDFQAIFFDVGGVLIQTRAHHLRHRWDAQLGLPLGSTEAWLFNSDVGKAAQQGLITYAQWWQLAAQHFALTPSQLASFEHDFWAEDHLSPALVALLPVLHQYCRLGIISNHADNLRHVLHTTHPIAQHFDTILISAEEKICKPAAEIYQRASQRLAAAPQACIFIDDFAHNLVTPQDLGWATIHYNAQLDLAQALRQLGIPC